MSKFDDWVYESIVEDEPVCAMVNVYDAVHKASDRFYDQTFEGNHEAAAEAHKEAQYYEGFLDSTECPKYPGF